LIREGSELLNSAVSVPIRSSSQINALYCTPADRCFSVRSEKLRKAFSPVRTAAEMLVKRKEDLARDMTKEMGKPLAEARGDVQEAIDMPRGLHYEGVYQLEDGVPAEIVEGLKKLGHKTTGVTAPRSYSANSACIACGIFSGSC